MIFISHRGNIYGPEISNENSPNYIQKALDLDLNVEIDKFKAMIEESNSLYDSILDKTTKSLRNIINNTESKSELQ